MKRWFCGLLALSLFLGRTGQATGQPTYAFTTLDVLSSSPYIVTFANGINASGQIVGGYRDAALHSRGFLLNQGSFTTLDPPGAKATFVRGINDVGQIVGEYADAAGAHGFLLNEASFTTLDVPGARATSARGINDVGQIVGAYYDAAYNSHGFLLDQGNYTTLDVPSATSTQAYGINAAGQIGPRTARPPS